ncbi:ATP dependent DNA ligase domain protein [Rhodoferax antarcticus ANT.BR]|uniref:ATP dependent DNA ligase domain protein n=1 Tax=Rhodoferax antarcticus ANT.BR TaxID=1111071 RepID=A0A1Q8Y9T6_9BURK|nr:ATP dependent DNA ligase domain protein [Rhodoferax antarcticus ANT.BR]
MNVAETCTLYCTEGASDKVYQASLRASGDLWLVDFAYGKRGTALKTGTKTNAPVDFKSAKTVFDKLVKSKMSGGYVPVQGNVAYTSAEGALESSGYLPMLPIALEEDEVDSYLQDDSWWLQEKKDGQNRMLLIRSGVVRGINRKGQFVNVPQDWADYLSILPDCLIAGEAVGNVFFAFDMLEINQDDLRGSNYSSRYSALVRLVGLTFKWFVEENSASKNRCETEKRFRIIEIHTRTETKRQIFESIKLHGGEGVVFKSWLSVFESGKTNVIRKSKFVESATCVVIAVNSQRSVQIGCFANSGLLVNLGNVTIPANHSIPDVDELVEIRYLYRFSDGCLEQPVYLGVRTDLELSDAVISQITRIKRKTTSVA